MKITIVFQDGETCEIGTNYDLDSLADLHVKSDPDGKHRIALGIAVMSAIDSAIYTIIEEMKQDYDATE